MALEVFLLGLLAGIFLDIMLAYFTGKNEKLELKTKKFHIHHSFHYGLGAVIAGFFILKWLLLGIGIGIILSHSIRKKRLLFIEIGKKKIF